jgi:hypothetical protein
MIMKGIRFFILCVLIGVSLGCAVPSGQKISDDIQESNAKSEADTSNEEIQMLMYQY